VNLCGAGRISVEASGTHIEANELGGDFGGQHFHILSKGVANEANELGDRLTAVPALANLSSTLLNQFHN
jgi:hypothetical protein